MKHFKLVKRGIDVAPLVEEIERNAELWDLDTSRQTIPFHRETRTILLHSHREPGGADKRFRESFPGCWIYVGRRASTAERFPLNCAFVERFTRSVGGILGRAALVNLKPNGRIYPHIDTGNYYRIRSRYHLVLQSATGSRLNSGSEGVTMCEGELWWFNNRIVHDAYNGSDRDRIHIIFDLVSPASLSAAGYRYTRNRASDLYRGLRRRIA